MPDPTYDIAVTSDEHEVILEDVTAPLVDASQGPIHVDRIMFTYGRCAAADPDHEYPTLGASNWHHYRHRPEWALGSVHVEGSYATETGEPSKFDAYESWSIGFEDDDLPAWLLELGSRFLPHAERAARVLPGEPTDPIPGG